MVQDAHTIETVDPKRTHILASIIHYQGNYYVYQGTSLVDKDIILSAEELACQIRGRSNKVNNEFKANDYLRFGRVCYRVRETSHDPLIPPEGSRTPGANLGQIDKSLDRTNAEAIYSHASPLNRAAQMNPLLHRLSLPVPNVLGTPGGLRNRIGSLNVPSPQEEARNKSKFSPRSDPQNHSNSKLSSRSKKAGETWSDDSEDAENLIDGQTKTEPRNKVTFNCRICLCDGDYEEEQAKNYDTNPLLSPCKCSGMYL